MLSPFHQQHTLSPIPLIVAVNSHISMLTIKFMLNKLSTSLGVDTSASVTLLSERTHSTLKL